MSKLHLETITPLMQKVLQDLMQLEALNSFRLVGGTALALQFGHRISVDLDLFTDKPFEFELLKSIIPNQFPQSILLGQNRNGQTWSIQGIKCDFYDWKVPFINEALVFENIRLTSIDDLAAFKLESFSNRKSEKDFRDIAEILRHRTLEQMLSVFKQRYPFIQTGAVIPILLTPESVEIDVSIQMLKKETFEQAADTIKNAIKSYEDNLKNIANQAIAEREKKILNMLKRKKKT